MADPRRQWAQGDEWEPSASQLNFWTHGAGLAHQALGGPASPLGLPSLNFVPIRVRNTTGEDIPRLGVVGYELPTIVPDTDVSRFVFDLTLEATAPATPLTRYAICPYPIPEDGVGVAIIYGIVGCRITGTGEQAEAVSGEVSYLQAGSNGYPILWQETGSSERWGLIHIGAGGTGCSARYECRIWFFPSGGSCKLNVTFNEVMEPITVNFDDGLAEIKTAVDAHSELVAASKECTVTGGVDMSRSNVFITMPEGGTIDPGDDSTLTRAAGAPVPRLGVTLCSCS